MIYFIRGTRSGMVKIGATDSLKRRLGELQTGSPEPLEVLALVEGGADQERMLHERFSDARALGEWFHPHNELLSFIEKLARDPRLHPALARLTTRQRVRGTQRSGGRLEPIRLAAAQAGFSEREWFEKFALPVVLEIAGEQLTEDYPSDAEPTLARPVPFGAEDAHPGLSLPGDMAAAYPDEDAA